MYPKIVILHGFLISKGEKLRFHYILFPYILSLEESPQIFKLANSSKWTRVYHCNTCESHTCQSSSNVSIHFLSIENGIIPLPFVLPSE